ncbi:DUF11 domain-containing protein [Amycolatopsis rhizosphaerae]|nr:DUF11 domain-containing protein [Amycolatopsis rhizosphaerae]
MRRVGMLALATAVVGSGLVFGAGTASAATPFTCAGQVFLAQSVGNGTQLYTGTFGAGAIGFTAVGPVTSTYYNAIGYNPADNYIYGIRSDSHSALWRIDATGTVTGYGAVTGLPQPGTVIGGATLGGMNVGGFGPDGFLHVTASNIPRMWAINVATNTVVKTINLTTASNVSDMVYSNGYFWGADLNGGIVRINPNTGGVETFAAALPAGAYGGVFTYGNGDIGFYDNAGKLYRVAVTNAGTASPTFQIISTQAGPSSGGNDATSCVAPATDLSITKVADPSYPASGPVPVGTKVTYTLTVHNNGPSNSSGYSVADQLPAGLSNVTTSSPGCTVTGSTLSCTGGALIAGADATITVSGVADGTAATLTNTASVRGNEADPNPANDTSNQVVTVVDVPLVPAAAAAGIFGVAGLGFGLRRRSRRKVATSA